MHIRDIGLKFFGIGAEHRNILTEQESSHEQFKPLTPAQIKGAIKATRYPSKQLSGDLTRSLAKLSTEQIKDGKSIDEVASYLSMAVTNRLPKGIETVDFAHEVSRRFISANQTI